MAAAAVGCFGGCDGIPVVIVVVVVVVVVLSLMFYAMCMHVAVFAFASFRGVLRWFAAVVCCGGVLRWCVAVVLRWCVAVVCCGDVLRWLWCGVVWWWLSSSVVRRLVGSVWGKEERFAIIRRQDRDRDRPAATLLPYNSTLRLRAARFNFEFSSSVSAYIPNVEM